MPTKIRKQIYLEKRQDKQLKRIAEARGVSEAQVIRELIDAQAAGAAATALPADPAAWETARMTMLDLLAQGPLPNRRRNWTRDDLYEERLSRYGRRSD
jgi:hypothetical protein